LRSHPTGSKCARTRLRTQPASSIRGNLPRCRWLELLRAGDILIDDRDGRIEAERRHLHVTGTVGVLAEGHLAGLLDFDQALARLRATNFRLSAEVERLVRQRLNP
jgi:hypothetical protein